jgi:arabinofuranosyltransferase
MTSTVRLVITLSIVFLMTVLVRTAWIADEAAIELRVAQNLVSGSGMRWNVAERVQAFADPLWVLLLSASDWIVRQPFVSAWLLSLVLIGCAVAVVVFELASDAAAAMMAVALVTFSKTFVEYSVSGFQTPLTVALLAGFFLTYWREPAARTRVTLLALFAALVALTDPLATLLVLPPLFVAAARVDGHARLRSIMIGAAPLAAWLIFAAVYYGFVLPNPMVAAIAARPPLQTLIGQGGYYLLDAVNNDPVAVAAIAAATGAAAFGVIRGAAAPAFGLVAFVATLVVSGGDALSGRSIVPAFASAVMLLSRFEWDQFGQLIVVPAALVVGLGLIAPGAPVLADADFGKTVPQWNRWPGDPAPPPTEMNHIRDERRLSYQSSGLLKGQRYVPLPDTSQAEVDVNAAIAAGRNVMVVDDRVGLEGIVAGARLHVVDRFGRADAFLARCAPDGVWRPGGVARRVPDDYLESLERGRDAIRDPKIAHMYEELALVTRGPLFSRQRIRAIVDLNLRWLL